jgi:hypothetical protein
MVLNALEQFFVDLWEQFWPFLLWLLTPLFFVVRQGIALVVWLDIRYLRDYKVSDTAKCPACGIRQKHSIQFAEDYACVLHTCGLCKAEWGSNTILPYDKWKVEREVEPPRDQTLG